MTRSKIIKRILNETPSSLRTYVRKHSNAIIQINNTLKQNVMEHKTDTTDDELIAMWDGWKRSGDVYEHTKWFLPYSLSEMKYKTSFDWIMPVFQKINSGAIDEYTCIHIDHDVVFVHLKGEDGCQQIPIKKALIGAIYKAVVIVLRWAENKKA